MIIKSIPQTCSEIIPQLLLGRQEAAAIHQLPSSLAIFSTKKEKEKKKKRNFPNLPLPPESRSPSNLDRYPNLSFYCNLFRTCVVRQPTPPAHTCQSKKIFFAGFRQRGEKEKKVIVVS